MKIVLLGTAWPYRGGLAAFNERLVSEFIAMGHEASIITFTLQYPNILFPGKTQFSSSPVPENISIKRSVNSVNYFNWRKAGKEIKKEAPDILIIKYWMPFMAPCFGTIAKMARSNKKTKVICIADNIIPHEQRLYDKAFTRYFIKQVDAFVVMSNTVMKELIQFNRTTLRATSPHPLFDNFGAAIDRERACKKLQLDPIHKYILFFGFIRDYKGLDILLEALQDERLKDIHCIVAGEYYTDPKQYASLLQHPALAGRIHAFNHFIADEEVVNFFCAADMVVQPYKHATQSGVTQIAYHFNVPMLVTHVGGLAEMVPDQRVGYVTEPASHAIANAMVDFYSNNRRAEFVSNILEEKKRFGWDRMADTIIQLRNKLF